MGFGSSAVLCNVVEDYLGTLIGVCKVIDFFVLGLVKSFVLGVVKSFVLGVAKSLKLETVCCIKFFVSRFLGLNMKVDYLLFLMELDISETFILLSMTIELNLRVGLLDLVIDRETFD